MQEIIKESEINMSMKANALSIGFDFYNINLTGDIAKSLQAEGGGCGVNEGCVLNATFRKKGHPQDSEQAQEWERTDINDTLNIFDNSENRTPTLIIENHPNDSRVKIREDGVFQTLSSRMGTGGGNTPMVMEEDMDAVVRRLTPLECERLQGYPDRWTDIGEWIDSKGKKHKDADSPRYKALGNSIGLPFWQWMADRMIEQLRRDGIYHPTMASLFSGIGGFELVYKRAGCEPVWASEIESFPIAVTKKHFGDDDAGIEGDIDQYL